MTKKTIIWTYKEVEEKKSLLKDYRPDSRLPKARL